MKRKEIFLVLALIAFGLLYQAVEKGRERMARDFSFYAGDRRPQGTRFSEFPGLQQGFSGVSRIAVVNPAGEVLVGASADGQVHLSSWVRVYHAGKEAPARLEPEVQAQGRMVDGTLQVSVGAPSPFPYRRLRVLLRLEVPPGIPLAVANQEGDVILRDAGGDLEVELKNGDLVLENASAGARLRLSNGTARIKGVAGEAEIRAMRAKVFVQDVAAVRLDGRHSDFVVRGVAGRAAVELAYGKLELDGAERLEAKARHGQIRAAHLGAGAVVTSHYAPVILEDAAGDVSVSCRSGRIELRRLSARAVMVENSYADVAISGFAGASLDVALKNGRLALLADRIDERVNISGSHADLDLSFAALVDPTFSIQAVHGRIRVPPGLGLESYEEKEESFANRDGGKPEIRVRNVYGDVKVSAGG